jgi:hypothetical protein
MAVIRAGILSRISGKVAGVVGGSWKDKAYIREYVIPANPNTDPQQIQRALMSRCVELAKALVGPVFNQYTDKFERSMSGFNRFIKDNIQYCLETIVYASIMMTNGKLWKPTTLTATLSGTTLTLLFDGVTLGNNGAADDLIYAAAYDSVSKVWFFPAAELERSTGTVDVTVSAGLVATNLHCYLWAAQYSPTSPTLLQLISNSIYDVAAAA